MFPGQLCAARFRQDEATYRAEVTSIKYQEVRVMFIDYGNNEEESMSAKDFTDIEVKCLASSTNNLQQSEKLKQLDTFN